MKINQSSQLRQYARVARIFPKTDLETTPNATNARIKVLATTNTQI